jgi:hypothetical protein
VQPEAERDVITDARAQEAFHYLNDNTGTIGAAKAELERSEILRKRARKRAFLGAPEGSTVAQKEAMAELDADVIQADERYVAAVLEYEQTKAKHEIEGIALDVWRTESANRRRA